MFARGLLISMLLAGGGGCATVVPATGGAPADLSLEVLAWNGSEVGDGYIVFPDGGLYVCDQETPPLPPRRRTLPRATLDDLWQQMTELGFTPEAGGTPPRGPVDPPPAGMTRHRVTVTAEGTCVEFGGERVVGDPDPAVAALLDELAVLAWRRELDVPEVTVLPKRYDLGPDPYARYRR